MTDEFYKTLHCNVSTSGIMIVINYFPMSPPERGFTASQGVKYSVQIKHCYNQFSPCTIRILSGHDCRCERDAAVWNVVTASGILRVKAYITFDTKGITEL